MCVTSVHGLDSTSAGFRERYPLTAQGSMAIAIDTRMHRAIIARDAEMLEPLGLISSQSETIPTEINFLMVPMVSLPVS
jgi:hypothetical protein